MKNLHLEHPEDTILNGDLTVLDWFVTPGNLSVKIDGSPAIVWGVNPENGKFFVGTKSVFNKRTPKICYTQQDVFALYDERTHASLIEILCACLKYLPRYDNRPFIYQGDFIGFGGSVEYKPNTITYKFPEIVRHKIIVAPHTEYYTYSMLKNSEAYSMGNMILASTDDVKFVQPKAYIFQNQEFFADVEEVCKFARQMATAVRFVTDKEAVKIKKQINSKIREGVCIREDDFDCDPNLIRFWLLVKSIKEDCLFLCRNNGPDAYIGNERVDSEGYVFDNDNGIFKLVNRETFSYANFNEMKVWSK